MEGEYNKAAGRDMKGKIIEEGVQRGRDFNLTVTIIIHYSII